MESHEKNEVTFGDPDVEYLNLVGCGGYAEVHKVTSAKCFHVINRLAAQCEDITCTGLQYLVMLILQVFARKIIHMAAGVSREEIHNYSRAITKLCLAGHRNIIRVLSHGWTGSCYIVDMELCSSTLLEYIKGKGCWEGKSEHTTGNRKLYETFEIMRQLSEAIRFVHSQGEVHRDVTPYNGISSSQYDN